MQMNRIVTIIILGGLLRCGLIGYAIFHDAFFEVKYTDVDYSVFTGAAAEVLYNGSSPYDMPTYRYTPLLAYLLIPNHILFQSFGKFLFCLFDLVSAWIIWRIVENKDPLQTTELKRGSDSCAVKLAVAIWLFNPLTSIVSSRGNAESLMSTLVLAVVYCIQIKRSYLTAATLLGLAVHFRLYPLIYLPSLLLNRVDWHCDKRLTAKRNVQLAVNQLLTNLLPVCLIVFVVSLVFSLLLCGFYAMYGFTFIYETYLYHFKRTDPQHNFSVYFYLFLLAQGASWEGIVSKMAFIPQFLSVITFSIMYADDVAFCWLVITFCFVALNKVCTSQYFLWYLCLLPINLHKLRVDCRMTLKLMGMWMGGQGLWLFWAYLLEFHGLPVRLMVELCSLLFLIINIYILYCTLSMYEPSRKSKLR